MRFELKTENENFSKSTFFAIFLIFSLIAILSDIALKIGNISRHYQISYHCKILSVDKSATNFKKLSKLSNLKSKQRIWEFCREVVK